MTHYPPRKVIIYLARSISSSWLDISWENTEPLFPWWQILLWPPASWSFQGLSRLYSSWKLTSGALWNRLNPEDTHGRDTGALMGREQFRLLKQSEAQDTNKCSHNSHDWFTFLYSLITSPLNGLAMSQVTSFNASETRRISHINSLVIRQSQTNIS